MFKMILGVLCVALGIWIAFNHPDVAQMILDKVVWGVLVAWDYVKGLLNI